MRININERADEPVFPDWFTISLDLGKNGYMKLAPSGQPVYHYTNLNAFMSILEKREFWASNLRYLNDMQEFEDGRQCCLQLLQKKIDTGDSKYLNFYQKVLSALERDCSSGLDHFQSNEIYSLSFCEKGDLLTQWQVYGSGGVSIGFLNNSSSIANRSQLVEHEGEQNGLYFYLWKVIYAEDEKSSFIEKVISYGECFIDKYTDSISMDMCIDGICDALFYFFPLMKNAAFQHEKEYRLYVFRKTRNPYPISFRQRGTVILPYIKFKITDLNGNSHERFPVADIVVAPGLNQERTAESIRYYLQSTGYDYLAQYVRCSKIPYQPV